MEDTEAPGEIEAIPSILRCAIETNFQRNFELYSTDMGSPSMISGSTTIPRRRNPNSDLQLLVALYGKSSMNASESAIGVRAIDVRVSGCNQ